MVIAHCTFCSLLCPITPQEDLRDCKLRQQHLKIKPVDECWIGNNACSFEDAHRRVLDLLLGATDLLFTGRVQSVKAAKFAIAIARKFNGLLDWSESQGAFDSIIALQSVGGFTVSIDEVSSRATRLIFIGDDSLLDTFPRLTKLLYNANQGRKCRVTLLGEFSQAILTKFELLGEVELIDCPLSEIPNWAINAKFSDNDYSVLVYATNREYPDGERWHRKLNEAIATHNEKIRVVALTLSGPNIALQQVCTWQTGFPGRIRFVGELHEPRYDPWFNTSAAFMTKNQNRRGGQPVVVHINELAAIDATVQQSSSRKQFQEIIFAVERPANLAYNSVFIPIRRVGLERAGTVFRADGCVCIDCDDLTDGKIGAVAKSKADVFATIANQIAQIVDV